MQLTALHRLLDELLFDASDDGLEVVLCAAGPTAGSEREAVQTEYSLRYTRAIGAVALERGAPDFSGSRRDPGAPRWMQGGRLTFWAGDAGVVYVALVESQGNPRLVAGARPYPYEGEAITLLPPGN